MQKDYCFLDRVRIDRGINKCKAAFLDVYSNDKWKAISCLNDSRITFPCLYVLANNIEVLNIEGFLSSRNKCALKIKNRIQLRSRYYYGEDISANDKRAVYPVYRWIFETGHEEDGMDDGYEAVMDAVVSVLVDIYKDNSILPAAADMIFSRNRKGHYTHDLLWAFFRSSTPEALKLIAERICSSNQQDADLACHLLNIEAPNAGLNLEDRQKQYQDYLKWLNENAQSLNFTGESFQYSSNPIICRVKQEGSE